MRDTILEILEAIGEDVDFDTCETLIDDGILSSLDIIQLIGALNDGLRGDASVLYIKSLLDGISSVVLGATLGPASSLPRCLFWYTRDPFPFWRVRWNRSSRVNCWGRSAAWATAWCCASASTFSA